MIYLTFQTTSGQGVVPEGQPQQLHIGPLAHVQWYGNGFEVEVEHGAGAEELVSLIEQVPGESNQGYVVQQINARAFSALLPYDGYAFGSVIIHDDNVACFDRANAQLAGEPIVDLRVKVPEAK